MKPKKIVYYTDPFHDDFAGNGITKKSLPKNFKYVNKNPFARFFTMLLYRLIGVPVLYLVGKIGWGVKVMGRQHLKELKNEAVYFYGNHTQPADAWLVPCYMTSKRSYIIADQEATSIPGIRNIVMMLGALPVPSNPEESVKFVEAIHTREKEKAAIVIYPEAHIWPYTTRIRPFGDASFVYPAQSGAPVVPFCTTYRARKIFKHAAPRMTVHIGAPIYPNMSLSLSERKKALRDAVYDFMKDKAMEPDNVEYIAYVQRKKEE